MKRTLSILLSLALIVGLCIFPAGAADKSPIVTLEPGKYKLSDLTDGTSELVFRNGLASVRRLDGDHHMYGYIDGNGSVVIPYQYYSARTFHNGSAIVTTRDPRNLGYSMGLINTSGEFILEPIYDLSTYSYFIEESTPTLISVKEQIAYARNKYGFVNSKGEFVVPLKEYDDGGNFNGSFAWLRNGKEVLFVDINGAVTPAFTLPNEFIQLTGDFKGDYCVIINSNAPSGLYGVIDRTGKIVIPAEYDDLRMLDDGFVSITKEEKTGLIQLPNGKEIFPLTTGCRYQVENKAIAVYPINLSGTAEEKYYTYDGIPTEKPAYKSASSNYSNSIDITSELNTIGKSYGMVFSNIVVNYNDSGDGTGSASYEIASKNMNGTTYLAVTGGYIMVSTFPDDTFALIKIPIGFSPSLNNFTKVSAYAPDQFADVADGQWYSIGIKAAFELGLMKGTSNSAFDLDGSITVGSTLATAARLHSIYNTATAEFKQGSPWYQTYVDYALSNGIIAKGFDDYNRPATRAEFAAILSGALPDMALSAKKTIADNSLPDVKVGDPYSVEIYRLYRAGVLTGNDTAGTFTPNDTIGRSSAATIVARMADPALRK